MSKRIKYLSKIIYYWCISQNSYGLTLPNIIGIIRVKAKNENYSIDNLFNELQEVDLDIKISFCNNLDEFVFGTFKREDAPKKYYSKINSIYFSINEIKITNYEELINFFKEKYKYNIDNGYYSKNYYTKEWSGLDLESIEILNKLE